MRFSEYLIETDITRRPFLDHEFEQCFELMKNGPLTGEEFNRIVNANKGNWKRGPRSLRMLAMRMHLLIHGELPEGIKAHPGWYDLKTKRLFAFIKEKGIDPIANLVTAAEREGIEISFLTPTEDYRSEILDGLKKLIPAIKEQVAKLSEKPEYKWLSADEVIHRMQDDIPALIHKLENKEDLQTILIVEFRKVVTNLISEHKAKLKNQMLKKKAKDRQKELKKRRMGTAWKDKI